MIDTSQYQQQLDYNQLLIKDMSPYLARKVGELPNPILEKLKHITYGPKITASGIESVGSIIEAITASNFYLKKALEDPAGFIKIYGDNKLQKQIPSQPTKKVSAPTPPESIISHAGENSSKPTDQKTTPKIVIKINPDHSTNKPQIKTPPKNDDNPPPVSNIEL